MKNKATEVFDRWAKNGKDEGMKKNHFSSYQHIKKIIKENCNHKSNLVLADVGCGNGWATGDLLNEKFIGKAVGYDGAPQMIKNAKSTIKGPDFFEEDLSRWSPKHQFDIIYSMEFLYYLKDPQNFIKNCFNLWLKPEGFFIAGIDHYQENTSSLSWEKDLGVAMQTKTVYEWKNILKQTNFIKNETLQVNQKEDWQGTLIFWGKKNDI